MSFVSKPPRERDKAPWRGVLFPGSHSEKQGSCVELIFLG